MSKAVDSRSVEELEEIFRQWFGKGSDLENIAGDILSGKLKILKEFIEYVIDSYYKRWKENPISDDLKESVKEDACFRELCVSFWSRKGLMCRPGEIDWEENEDLAIRWLEEKISPFRLTLIESILMERKKKIEKIFGERVSEIGNDLVSEYTR